MLNKLYSIRCNKSGIYQNPLTSNNLIELQRGLESAIKKEGIPFNTHTGDFELYELGSFSPETGLMQLNEKPKHILNLIDLKGE